MSDRYAPRPEHKFSFGLWTVGNRGRDPFGDAVRDPLPPVDAVALLGRSRRVGREPARQRSRADRRHALPSAIASSRSSRRRAAATASSCRWPPSTCSSTRSSATAPSPPTIARVRAYALQKTMQAMDLGAELGAKIFVLWGGREGTETDACRRPDEAIKRLREAVNYLCEYSIDRRVRLQVRARSQAERAARRHLHGDDRRLSRASSRRSIIPRWSA